MLRVGLVSIALAATALGLLSANVEGRLWIVNTDYDNPAEISSMEIDHPWTIQNNLFQACPDPVLRESEGLLYVIGRLGCGDIEVIDPDDDYNVLQSFSVGANLNPQDIALLSPTRGYVTRYDSNWVLEVNPTTGAILDSVSLQVFADDDGFAELSRMAYVGPYLFVQVQRLDRSQFYSPVGDSYLAVIDTFSGELVDVNPGTQEVDGISLAGTNPFGEMWLDESGSALWVSEVGSFGVFDGGIDRVDVNNWVSTGFVTTEADLSGDLLEFTTHDEERFFALVANASFVTCVRAVDPATGVVDETLLCASGYDFADLAASSNGYLYLADRADPNYGVRVFDAETGIEETSMAISTGDRKPVQLVLADDDLSDVATEIPERIAPTATPNPSSAAVEFRLDSSEFVQVEIIDTEGRRVSVVRPAAGLVWDGRDATGQSVSPGVYWARAARRDGTTETLRIVRVP